MTKKVNLTWLSFKPTPKEQQIPKHKGEFEKTWTS